MAIRHKFRAKPCERDSMHFDSKAERAYYDKLKLLQSAGDVLFFLRQVPLHIAGGVKYVADFLVFYANGDAEFIDVKGFMTPMAKAKIKQVEALYPIEIKIIQA